MFTGKQSSLTVSRSVYSVEYLRFVLSISFESDCFYGPETRVQEYWLKFSVLFQLSNWLRFLDQNTESPERTCIMELSLFLFSLKGFSFAVVCTGNSVNLRGNLL